MDIGAFVIVRNQFNHHTICLAIIDNSNFMLPNECILEKYLSSLSTQEIDQMLQGLQNTAKGGNGKVKIYFS